LLRIGIIGVDQVGKTTLFTILTRAHGGTTAAGRKFEAHIGVVHVPDTRLDRLSEIYHPQKKVYASVEYVDTPGGVIELSRTGSQAQVVREVNALVHVVRAFANDAIPAPEGSVNPRRDIENVELELILSDLAVIEKRLERLDKDIKKQKSPGLEKEHQVLLKAKAALEKQTPLREIALDAEEARAIKGFTFLSQKPVLYVLNLGENDAARTDTAEAFAREAGLKQRPSTAVSAVCGKVEAELAELPESEAAEFLASYGLKESAITRLIRASYNLLGLISFFTVG